MLSDSWSVTMLIIEMGLIKLESTTTFYFLIL